MIEILLMVAVALLLAALGFLLAIGGALRRLASADPTAALAAPLREEFRASRQEASQEGARLREEVARRQDEARAGLVDTLTKLGAEQAKQLSTVTAALDRLAQTQREEAEKLRERVETRLREIQTGNEQKLEEMRRTVDEKLQTTLERRLGESFKIVSDRLEAVRQGLGEMKTLAEGVGDLKRVLTNVKTRGTWGEVRLAEILEQILTPDQYAANVAIAPDGRERVEFAIRLPGRRDGAEEPVWLPVDSKFPVEDYERLTDAAQAGDAEAVRKASDDLAKRVLLFAKEIRAKYIAPPYSTDFAILFLPTEGLYAEVLRRPGFCEQVQREHRVVLAGPTTFAALLNSLRMGFRTLAIEKRSGEVWKILSAVKTEFAKFGDVLIKAQRQVEQVGKTLGETAVRNRQMARKLQSVESLPEAEARELLALPALTDARDADDESETPPSA